MEPYNEADRIQEFNDVTDCKYAGIVKLKHSFELIK